MTGPFSAFYDFMILKRILSVVGLASLTILVALTPLFTNAEPILHIEWAAGNYAGLNQGDPQKQFVALKNSLDEVLAKYEPRGTIYINDIDELGMSRAIAFAADYLRGKGIFEGAVQIRAYPGDIFTLAIPKTTTATLRNPEPIRVLLPLVTNKKERLLDIAAGAREGLNIVTYESLVKEESWRDWVGNLEKLNPEKLEVSPDEVYWDFASKADGHWMFYMKYRRYLLKACDGYLN